jgi:hypothetical protein
VTALTFLIAFGVLWVSLAAILLFEPEGRRSPKKVLFWCGLGWIGMWAAFVGWGALGG